MQKLRRLDRRLLVICATSREEDIPEAALDFSDALYWKELAGYDFSAYSIGLHAISTFSPSADVFAINDSVFGPFGDISSTLDHARWALTGFTASSRFENHVQSYAFQIRDLTSDRMNHIRSVFPLTYAYDDFVSVIYCFETALARVASRHMTVGACWYGTGGSADPPLSDAITLLDRGFPFLKKSLLGKHIARADEAKIKEALLKAGCSPD